MKYIVEINKVTKRYSSFAIEEMNLKIPSGCITGLVGRNGAGKSTLIKLLLDIIYPDSGEIKIFGESIHFLQKYKEEIGVVLDQASLPEYLKAEEINQLMKSFYQTWNSKKFFSYLEQFQIEKKKKIKDYSKGMKTKLHLAVAFSHETKLLILDEATSGLDPVVRDEILDILLEFIQDEEHSVIISSHILSDLEKACDYIAFLHEGKLEFMESKDEVMEKYGILRCSKEELAKVNPKWILGVRNSQFMSEALVLKEIENQLPFKAIVDPARMEEIMIFMERGEK